MQGRAIAVLVDRLDGLGRQEFGGAAAQVVDGLELVDRERLAPDVDVVDRIDTETTPWTITSGTYASRFSVVVGGAVQRAAARLAGNLILIASHLLEERVEDLEISEGDSPDLVMAAVRQACRAALNRYEQPKQMQVVSELARRNEKLVRR